MAFYQSGFGTFINEGMRLLAEGVHPAQIEMAALKAGMPVGPLAIQDEVSLTLTEHITQETRRALQAEGKPYLNLQLMI